MKTGIAGRLAELFLDSKLTPLLLGVALAIGVYSVFSLPSREEPEIEVPVADIYLAMPGATPQEVENRALIPIEEILSGIEGVRYVYTHAQPGFGLATVRYEVGQNMEQSLVRLHSRLMEHADEMPAKLQGFPLVKPVTIDDVPFFTVTLSGEGYDHTDLRSMGEELAVRLENVEDVREVDVIGGYPREIRVELRPDRMAAYGVDPAIVAERLQAANTSMQAGEYTRDGEVVRVEAGPFLGSAEAVSKVVLDVREGTLVQVEDVARVIDGPAEPDTYTFHRGRDEDFAPMVTLAVSKRPGADATQLGSLLKDKIDAARGRLLPRDVIPLVTRNYGETAQDKVSTLRLHLLIAILAVGLVVWLGMGWRSGLVVMMAVPVTFALTLLIYQAFDYTLNRVTLFALIFVTGIVIDDSIIIVENMHRHFSLQRRATREIAIQAVNEVGNPTILATLTVIAAVLPMLFVTGLMGPYMSPMPIGSTLAMLFSLLVALIGAPWLAYRLLRGEYAGSSKGGAEEGTSEHGEPEGQRTDDATASGEQGEPPVPEEETPLEQTKMYRLYQRVMGPLLQRRWRIWAVLGGVLAIVVGAAAMFLTRDVTAKMLPFDDKNELQVIVDAPEGTPLEATAAFTADIAETLTEVPEVKSVQQYVGTAAPFNFNGLIRHYYLREGPNVADIQVNLIDKGKRSAKSHDVAGRIRDLVTKAAQESPIEAQAKIVEVPPGPPVRSTLVAEVYGRDRDEQEATARRVRETFEQQPGVIEVDWSLTAPQRQIEFEVDEEKAALSGVPKGRIVQSLRMALAGQVVSELSAPDSRTDVPVRLRLAEGARSGGERLAGVHVASMRGEMVPIGELVHRKESTLSQTIDRKNGHRVIYVTADVSGEEESPVYAILDLDEKISDIELSSGDHLGQLFTRTPRVVEQPVMKWDGEWQITYEVFRDLGIAFAGALVLIYVLIVAWFGSFTTPLVMMAAIPLTLAGIAPGHYLFGAFFTATSMIGMIALAGIMVRNGILLIDYLESRLSAGVPLDRAVIEAGAVRTRPILLTAGTVVIGAIVILFDPIFEGLAVSLIAGAVASTALTLIVVPAIYYLVRYRKYARPEPPAPETED